MSPATLTADPVALQLVQSLPSQVLSAAWATLGALPAIRSGAAVSTDGTNIYLSHGTVGGTDTLTASTITAAGVVSTATSAPSGYQVTGATGAWCNGRHHALGGMVGTNTQGNAVAYTPAGTNGAAGTWTPLPAMPGARVYGSAAAVGQFVYYAGGQSGSAVSTAVATLYRYDTTANTWSTLAAMPAARTQGAMVAVGTKLYYLGGYTSASSTSNVVYVFDTVAGTWSTGTALPGAVVQCAATAVGSTIIVQGSNNGSVANVTYAFDGTAWSTIASPTTAHGSYPGLVSIGSVIYLVSGVNTANVDALDTRAITELAGSPSPYLRKLRAARSYLANRFPAAAGVAAQIPDTMPSAGWSTIGALPATVYGAAITTDGTNIYASHGYTSGSSSSASRTISAAGVVTGMTAASVSRMAVAGTWCNGRHWSIGGNPFDGSPLGTVEAYTPAGANGASGSWGTATSLPNGRTGAAAAAVGTYLYVAGGSNNVNTSSVPYTPTISTGQTTFWRYNTANGLAGTWETLAPMPAARTNGSMVALGTKVYYLGGLTTANALSRVVYVYDTVAGTWSTGPDLGFDMGGSPAAVLNGIAYATNGSGVNGYNLTTGATVAVVGTTPTAHGGQPGLAAIGSTLVYVSGASTPNVDALDLGAAPRFAGLVAALRNLVLAA